MKKILLLLMFLLIIVGCEKKEEPNQKTEEESMYVPIIIEPTINYMCYGEYDEVLIGNKCVYEVTTPAPFRYACPYGYTVEGISCKKNSSLRYTSYCDFNESYFAGMCYEVFNADIEYYCINGGTIYGTQCIYEYSYDAYIEYSCPEGFQLINNKCYK